MLMKSFRFQSNVTCNMFILFQIIKTHKIKKGFNMNEQIKYYENKLKYELDSFDLFHALNNGEKIVVVDARRQEGFESDVKRKWFIHNLFRRRRRSGGSASWAL